MPCEEALVRAQVFFPMCRFACHFHLPISTNLPSYLVLKLLRVYPFLQYLKTRNLLNNPQLAALARRHRWLARLPRSVFCQLLHFLCIPTWRGHWFGLQNAEIAIPCYCCLLVWLHQAYFSPYENRKAY